jgi:hypothetical protein
MISSIGGILKTRKLILAREFPQLIELDWTVPDDSCLSVGTFDPLVVVDCSRLKSQPTALAPSVSGFLRLCRRSVLELKEWGGRTILGKVFDNESTAPRAQRV